VQTFGDLVTFHPHIHALVTDGVFDSDGAFRVLPPIPTELLEQQLRRAVLEMLLADEAIDEDLVAKLLSWQHSGFSVDNQVRIEAGDAQGRQQLARYMIRAPFSLEKTEYKAGQGVIVYRSKQHATLKRNFARLVPETHLRPWRLARRFAPGESFRSCRGPSGWRCFCSMCPTGASIWCATTAG
jgi:hypothetical protein